MPLVFKHSVLVESTLAVWEVTESEEFFLDQAHHDWDKQELASLKGARRLEWIASRYLIQLITPDRYEIKKDGYGKPQLRPQDYHISISHSHGYVAAIYSKRAVGVDIQKKVSKIDRIAHKFINEAEDDFIHDRSYISKLHVIWGAKESLFKAYGRKEVDFKKDLLVEPFTYRKKGKFNARVDKTRYQHRFTLENLFFNKFYLVYCEQIIQS